MKEWKTNTIEVRKSSGSKGCLDGTREKDREVEKEGNNRNQRLFNIL